MIFLLHFLLLPATKFLYLPAYLYASISVDT